MRRRSFLIALALAAAAPKALAKEGAAGPQNIVRVRSVMVPVIADGRVERYATYEITLEIAVPGKIPELQGMTPRLQDTATAVIYEGVDKGWIVRGALANGTALRQRMDEAFAKLVGKGTVGRILIAPATRSGM
ncbi:MAG TPA: hypothetical protein VD978_18715 [Azospirillum sp.]|nr:hypothetical protein [Azospirillum sp.]